MRIWEKRKPPLRVAMILATLLRRIPLALDELAFEIWESRAIWLLDLISAGWDWAKGKYIRQMNVNYLQIASVYSQEA